MNRQKHDSVRLTLRLRKDMADQLEELVDLMGTDPTHELRNALRERLEKHNLWPPPKG